MHTRCVNVFIYVRETTSPVPPAVLPSLSNSLSLSLPPSLPPSLPLCPTPGGRAVGSMLHAWRSHSIRLRILQRLADVRTCACFRRRANVCVLACMHLRMYMRACVCESAPYMCMHAHEACTHLLETPICLVFEALDQGLLFLAKLFKLAFLYVKNRIVGGVHLLHFQFHCVKLCGVHECAHERHEGARRNSLVAIPGRLALWQ